MTNLILYITCMFVELTAGNMYSAVVFNNTFKDDARSLVNFYVELPYVDSDKSYISKMKSSLLSYLALREIKKLNVYNEELIGTAISSVIIFYKKRPNYKTLNYKNGDKNYKKALYLLKYLRKNNAKFGVHMRGYNDKDEKTCYVSQAGLFLMNKIDDEIDQLMLLNLRIALLNNTERNQKDIKSNKIYCRKSVNDYLEDTDIQIRLKKADISEIKIYLGLIE